MQENQNNTRNQQSTQTDAVEQNINSTANVAEGQLPQADRKTVSRGL